MIGRLSKAERAREYTRQQRVMLPHRRAIELRMRAELKRTAHEGANAYRQRGEHALSKVRADHRIRTFRILKPHVAAIAHTFAEHVAHAATKQKKATEAEVMAYIDQYAEENTLDMVDDISGTTLDQMRETIRQGLNEGVGPQEIADRLDNMGISDMSRARAATIARTEMHRASMVGSVNAAQSLASSVGLLLDKVWNAVEDKRTRDDHTTLDGQKVGMDEPFEVNGSQIQFPGDPAAPPEQTINCRCVLTYEPSEDQPDTPDYPDDTSY